MQQTNTNIAPFFDDYDPSKNFHRILFKSGRPVQARELNQIQTILQEQIERFGDGIYTDGSLVVPGGISINANQASIGVNLTGNAEYTDITSVTSQLYIQGKTSGILAKVQLVFPVSGTDPICFIIDYENAGNLGTTPLFTVGEAIGIVYYDSDGVNFITAANADITSVNTAIWAKVLAGIYFVRGFFVETEDQNIVISKFSNTVSARVGFDVVESIIDETTDSSLYSNANGSPNFKAAGAARLKISLAVNTYALDATPTDFVELARIESGSVVSQVTTSTYSILNDVLAQRTYEESGNYTVDSFGVGIKEHLKTDTNDGVYTASEGGDSSLFVSQVKPGIAYVKGYRVANTGVVNVAVSKARDTAFANNSVIAADYGPYVVVNSMYSIPQLDITLAYQLQDSSNTQIGTCSIRAIRREGTGTYRLYLFNIVFNTGKTINDVARVYFNDSSNLFHGNLVSAVLFDGSIDSIIFKLPYDSIQTLKPSGAADTSYSVLRSFNLTTDASGNASVTLASNEVFSSLNNYEFFIGYTGSANTGTIIDPTSVITFSGSPTGRQMTLTLGSANANKAIKVNAPVIKQSPAEKTKTLTAITESFVLSGVSSQILGHSDVLDITSVIETLPDSAGTADVTDQFTFDNGQRDDWYENGILKTIGSVNVSKTIAVTYRYFAQSSGDYFSVDSYGGIDRSLIPSYTKSDGSIEYSLADCLDFRPTKLSGSFTVVGEIIKPGDNIRADINYYLPRVDSLYIDSTGNFGVVKGIASDNPVALAVPDNAMKIYELQIPAYTANVTAINVVYVENKRYTMRDIGALETRIANLEYYTTLNELEANTNSIQILDSTTGNNRYKNGFAVDGFTSYTLAQPSNPIWGASMDTNDKTLEAGYAANVVDLAFVSGTTVQQIGDTYTLPFNEVAGVVQPNASSVQNVNPFAFNSWVGNLTVSPNLDYFSDVGILPYARDQALPDSYLNDDSVTTYYPTGYYDSYWYNNLANSLSTRSTSFYYSYGQWEKADWYLDTGYAPFVRSRTIAFKAYNLKPLSRLYFFINGVDITSFVTQTGGTTGTIQSDSTGSATGVILLPDQEDIYFTVGTAVIRVCDSQTNDETAISTLAETNYYSGYSFSQNKSVIATGSTRKNQSTVVSAANIRQRSEIAQTFSGSGNFISSISLYFASAAVTLPVTLQLRPVTNGYPTTETLPFASVTLLPSAVNISADGTVETKFTFTGPVFAEQNKDYAIVLLSDSPDYTVYAGNLGAKTYSGKNISKRAQVGSFMTSTDNSSWVIDTTKDLEFSVYNANYTSTSGQIIFGNIAPQNIRPISFNAISCTNGSNVLVVKVPSHGLNAGDTFTIQNGVSGNGIADTDINASHTATAVTLDTITFAVTPVATSDGTLGGSNMAVTVNYPFSRFFANFETVNLPGTAIKWEYSYKAQSNRQVSSYTEFDPTATQFLDAAGVVINTSDLLFRCTLSTSNASVSPVIDTTGMGALVLDMRTNTDVNNPAFAYVTLPIKFDNPSTSARFYVGAKMPGNSSLTVSYKLIQTPGDDLTAVTWTALSPTKPIVNDASNYKEYEFDLDSVGSFIGYQLLVSMYSNDSSSVPSLSDIRTIALA